ncbi:DegT/DnrJ/EryC1/StrS family aminotransferase [Microvirga sp. W0021]|uniref:DegT/DnrJ/EryC1/StrS family aminotransferase n=1 Tax=Hohaiivirga grylli TaxID=3133970 RepID=A0ABV0BG31_9HYPH
MDINVTKPYFPPLEDFQKFIKGIWHREWLTNNGPLVNELELSLKDWLGLDHLLYVSNGTIALQIAIKSLELTNDIITTPFSYVATTSSILWENCNPIMVDICKETLNIDADKIEERITPNTTGILATHVYGNPCNIEKIDAIAQRHNLKVIYDAAHAFGTKYKNKSLYAYGDISTASFHATKLFHTIEGGALITKDPSLLKKMASMRNFGHTTPTEFDEIGINGKNSEIHAAMGLCNLEYVTKILSNRKYLSNYYDFLLSDVEIKRPKIAHETIYNYSYYPVIFNSEEILLKIVSELNINKIFPRRYFYPSLSKLSYIKSDLKNICPISEDISKRVLCLPLYYTLSTSEIDMICRIIKRTLNY